MIEREGLKDESVKIPAEALVHAGEWATFHEGEFSKSEEDREAWLAESVKEAFVRGGEVTKAKSGKKNKRWNPLDALGRPVIGRPRKDWDTNKKKAEPEAPTKRGRPPKRKVEESETVDTELPAKKKRGRPPKARVANSEVQPSNSIAAVSLNDESAATHGAPAEGSLPKRRRPRMRKPDTMETTASAPSGEVSTRQDHTTASDATKISMEPARNSSDPSSGEKACEVSDRRF